MISFLGSDWDRGYRAGRLEGIREEREATIRLLLRNVCRDYMKTDACPHGACEDLRNTVDMLREKA